MNLLILLNGKKDVILKANNLIPEETEVVKVDEKRLSQPGFILNLIGKNKYSAVYFGCIENELQRFHIFMKIYIMFSGINQGAIIDEYGNRNSYRPIKLIFVEIPSLILEAFVSIFVVLYFYVKLPVMKWCLSRRS